MEIYLNFSDFETYVEYVNDVSSHIFSLLGRGKKRMNITSLIVFF